MDNMKFWAITLNNFQGESDIIYFKDEKSARISFDALCKQSEHFPEYEKTENEASWFDDDWNWSSTIITISKREVELNDSITDWY